MNKKKRVVIVGGGSLGSFTALLCAKIAGAFGWEIWVRDRDKVETHNLLNQLYRESDIGKEKVVALKNTVEDLTGSEIHAVAEKVDLSSELHGIVIVLVDNMKARKEIFAICKYQADIPYYIEARSEGTSALIYAFSPRNCGCVREYEKTLYDDKDAVPAPCADQRTVPIIWLIAGTIVRLLARFFEKKRAIGEYVEIVINTEGLPYLDGKLYNK